ncbi:interleukin-11-like isoform X1 [Myxocyprinus asiaticus]|uniref:interleukin-11-like isoform X1 n=1 Tax=Myxocyprinus asiaticus TaxID=70543 RepID=UPI00222267F4|nr:interleukin-11-like isoform X1 [Myxocyprinus asiaticus]
MKYERNQLCLFLTVKTGWAIAMIILMSLAKFFTTAHPAPMPRRKEGLHKLQQELCKLSQLITQEGPADIKEILEDFEHDITSLPTLYYTVKDLKSLEVSSTLAQLYSGLKSFMFHLDWLQKKQEESEVDFSKTKKIFHKIQDISHTVLRQIGTVPPELVYPTLPPLNTAWSMYQATMEIHKKLFNFCDWYTRALGVLKHRQ